MEEDIVIGSDNFSKRLANELKAEYLNVNVHTFPDNETKPTLEIKHEDQIKGKNVLVVSRTNRFEPNPNDAIIELGLTVRNLNHLEAEEVGILMPYLHYARQDESFRLGEPSSFWYLARLYERWFTDFNEAENNLITLNSHLYGKKRGINSFFRSIKTHDLSSAEVFGEYFGTKGLKDPVVVVPGPEKLAKELSEQIDADYEALTKERDHRTGKIALAKPKTSFKDRDVIIYDDISSTGGTVKATVDFVSETDPHRVYVALTHLMTRKGIENIYNLKIDEVVTTDSFESGKNYKRFTELSTVPLFSDYIKKL